MTDLKSLTYPQLEEFLKELGQRSRSERDITAKIQIQAVFCP